MNDVVVRYNYGNTFKKRIKYIPDHSHSKHSRMQLPIKMVQQFRLLTKGNIKSTTYSIRKEGEKDFTETTFAYEPQENIYLLTENVKDDMGAEYKVTVNYSDPISTQSEAQAFIFKNEADGLRWEIIFPWKYRHLK